MRTSVLRHDMRLDDRGLVRKAVLLHVMLTDLTAVSERIGRVGLGKRANDGDGNDALWEDGGRYHKDGLGLLMKRVMVVLPLMVCRFFDFQNVHVVERGSVDCST